MVSEVDVLQALKGLANQNGEVGGNCDALAQSLPGNPLPGHIHDALNRLHRRGHFRLFYIDGEGVFSLVL